MWTTDLRMKLSSSSHIILVSMGGSLRIERKQGVFHGLWLTGWSLAVGNALQQQLQRAEKYFQCTRDIHFEHCNGKPPLASVPDHIRQTDRSEPENEHRM